MARVTRSLRVEQDLLQIAEYIAADNPAAASHWLDEVERTFSLLASFPTVGQDVGEIRPGLRRFSLGSYLIYFESLSRELRIVRVLHGSRDITRADEF
jgi:toxin ParE1/3/4